MTTNSSDSARVAIVTGAAAGLGRFLAEDLVSKGWKVACFDIDEKNGSEVQAELGSNSIFIRCDVTDYDDQARAFAKVWDKWNRIDALIANAGLVDNSSIFILRAKGQTEIPPKPNLISTDVCFKGLVYGTQLAIHFMRQNLTPGGHVVATSSLAGQHHIPSFPEYSAAKAAIIQFVRATAPILKVKENITINAVVPGIVPTRNIPQEMRDSFGPELCDTSNVLIKSIDIDSNSVTPLPLLAAAYSTFLNDQSLNGQAYECSGHKTTPIPHPQYVNGEASKKISTIYEPYFKIIHGEFSGIEGTIS